MPVNIPIAADASAVVSAFRQIQAAIDRAGQTGKAFKDLDLSHPELASMAGEIQKVQRRFEDLARLGRGETAAAVRALRDPSGGVNVFGPNGFATGGLQSRYPNQATANRIFQQGGSYVLAGTQWQAGTNQLAFWYA